MFRMFNKVFKQNVARLLSFLPPTAKGNTSNVRRVNTLLKTVKGSGFFSLT